MKHIFLLVFITFCFSCSKRNEKGHTLIFNKLTVNSKVSPLTVETETPLFGWIVDAKGFNKFQSAYHILVASSDEKLNENEADLWNSNKVESDASIYVPYAGELLEAENRYFWKVRIWDEQGNMSNWSEAQVFEMGLMNDENWGNSKWITLNRDKRTSEYRFREYKTGKMNQPVLVDGFPASYFRNELVVNKDVSNAQVYIVGLGYYELFLNGKKVGDQVLDPAPSNYEKQAYYVNYDISKAVKLGNNAFGIILGNGFYGQNISWKNDPESEKDLAYGPPAVRCVVKLRYTDGTESVFCTDETWKESTGPIVFNNIYGGDTYDARYELGDWTVEGYNDKNWGNPKTISPDIRKVDAQIIPPIKKLKELEPKRVFQGTDGEWIVDFGQNIAGWVKLNVQEKEGQVIEIINTEALLTDGSDIFQGSTGGGANGMPQIYRYICKGKTLESWEPKFSYHGFRYSKIKGISSKPDAHMIKAVLVATDIEETGSFSCSDDLLNKMHKISKWTIFDNIHGIPEDCPHREKCGWLGDAHAFCEYALYNYDMYDFYKKYMVDIVTQMRQVRGHNNPDIKYKAPTMIAPGKRTSTIAKIDWGVATMYLPWYNYKFYGDDRILKDHYEDMKILTQYYLSFKGDNGIMQNGMGDWCPPLWDRRLNPEAMECDPVISANAYFFDVLGIMENLARMTNDSDFETIMKAEKEALKRAFNKEYLVEIPNTNYKWYQSQTATVQALQFGLVPEYEIQNVLDGLEYDVVTVKGGHHSTGIHGNRYIYTVLSKYGKADLAYEILTTPEFPSQNYIMNSGFTTWPERQFVWDEMKGPTNSLNHPMHSGFAAYFFESLGGIRPSTEHAGFKEFSIEPQYPRHLSSTKVAVPSPYGTIQNDWEIKEGRFVMNLKVPFNTRAKLVLSEEEFQSLEINGQTLETYKLEQDIGISEETTLIIGSGDYVIQY